MNLKKTFIAFMMFAFVTAASFAATMNPVKGYKDLAWGTTVKQAQNKGFKLSLATGEIEKAFTKMFTKKVSVYEVKVTDKDLAGLFFIYYNEKLFYASEVLNPSYKDLSKLRKRYGQEIVQADNGAFVYTVNGKIYSYVTASPESVLGNLFDHDVYAAIYKGSSEDASNGNESKGEAGTFVSQFDSLAQKLLQDPKSGSKATYAFIDLTTDNGNRLVEEYITDALTEAVFNTGKVRIIERANLEKILNEQKFQASGLVDESQVANIGNIAGVEYICYGTIKAIEGGYTVNVRVVDVEIGEICAMGRTNIKNDSYLENNAGSAGAKKSSTGTKAAAAKPVNSLWTCTQNRNEFDGYTTYTFTLKGPEGEFFFMGYDKFDNAFNSRVKAGICFYKNQNVWNGWDNSGPCDFKTEKSGIISKQYSTAKWSPTSGWPIDDNSFVFAYNSNDSPRFFIELFENNNYVTVRHQGKVRRFQTAGFWDTVEAYGITKQEILDAIANEEF